MIDHHKLDPKMVILVLGTCFAVLALAVVIAIGR